MWHNMIQLAKHLHSLLHTWPTTNKFRNQTRVNMTSTREPKNPKLALERTHAFLCEACWPSLSLSDAQSICEGELVEKSLEKLQPGQGVPGTKLAQDSQAHCSRGVGTTPPLSNVTQSTTKVLIPVGPGQAGVALSSLTKLLKEV